VKLGVSLLLVVAGLAACANPVQQARAEAIDQATTGARNAAAKTLDYLRSQLSLSPQAFADTLKSLPDNFQEGVVTVHDSTRDPSGAFSARVVILGSGEAGGGGFYEQLDVRLCVKYSGAGGHVDVADTPCPDDLPTEDHGLQIEQNVTLK
jgi:hypothetical protein